MNSKSAACTNFIIGGTIKAATSSVFAYLSAHPEVCGSSVKETFFFTSKYSGDADRDLAHYMKYFALQPGNKIAVEASPNYLAYKEVIAPRINALLPDAKLLFILRDPVDRLYSYYNFAVGNLQLPDDLGFDRYIDLCELYSSSELTQERAGIAEKHLRALEIGEYSKHLKTYFDAFARERIKVAFYDDLKRDPARFMEELSYFCNVDPDFYRDYTFNRVNVTFSAQQKYLHHIALSINRILEPVLRQRPNLKMRLVQVYKRLNQDREGYAAMNDPTRERLEKYYARSNKELAKLLTGQPLPAWIKEQDGHC